MSIRIDKIQLEFAIRNDKARQEIAKMDKTISEMTTDVKKLEKAKEKAFKKYKDESHPEVVKATQAYEIQRQKLGNLISERNKLQQSLGVEGLSLAELRNEIKKYNAQIANLTPGTEIFNQTKAHLDALKQRLNDLNDGAKQTKSSIMEFTKGFNNISFAIINFLSLKDRFQSWAQPFVDEARRLSDTVADVAKYTGQTTAEVERMNQKLLQIDTRTSIESLDELAGAAGRLGISAERDIIGFVDAADKINTALGDDLGEGAIDAIGKMTMVFGEDKTKGLNGAMLATGSALNELGAASSANTGYIADFTSKLAAVAVQARISQTDIMGYASALSQAGETGETAASVLTQFLVKMFSDPAKFAKAAKLDVQEFTNLIRTDANQAVLTFLSSMKETGGFEQLAPMLKSLKMQGTQAVPVLTELANGLDNITEAQRLAREAYDEGTSIINEFNTVNNTAQARLEKTEKQLSAARRELGEKLLPIVEKTEAAGVSGIRVLSSFVSSIIAVRGPLIALTTALAAYLAGKYTYIAYTQRQIALDAIQKGYHTVMATLLNARTVATALYNRTLYTLRGNTIGAARAQVQLNAAMSANAVGALIAGVSALGVAVAAIIKEITKVSSATRELNDAERETAHCAVDERTEMEQLVRTVRNANSSEEDRKKALEAINGKLMEQHLGNLTEEDIRTGNAKRTLDRYNDSVMQRIRNEVLLEKLKDAQRKHEDAENGEFDVSWIDRTKQVLFTLAAISTKGFSAAADAWRLGGEALRRQALDDTQDTIDAIRAKIEENDTTFTIYRPVEDRENPTANTDSPVAGNNDTDENELEKQIRAARKTIKEQEELAKAERQKADLEAKDDYQKKLITEEQYHDKRYQNEKAYIQRINEIRNSQYSTEAEKQEAQNMQLDSLINEANYQQEQKKKKLQQQLSTIEQTYAADQIALEQLRMDGQFASEDEYNRRKIEAEIDYWQQRLNIIKASGGDTLEAERSLMQARMKLFADERQKQTDEMSKQAEAAAKAHDYDQALTLQQKMLASGLITQQQYEDAKTQLTQKGEQDRQKIREAFDQQAQQLMQASSQLFQAMQQREESRVQKKYKALIDTARKNGQDTTKLEEQQEEELLEIRKRYADKQFALTVLQIIADTARGIQKIWAEWGWNPPVAAGLTATTAAVGAIQLATAKIQRDQAAGLYTGGYSDADGQSHKQLIEGYTGDGDPREVAGVIPVHRREFVINHQALRIPAIQRVADIIDGAQQRRNYNIQDTTRQLRQALLPPEAGLAQGGYNTNPSGTQEALTANSPYGNSIAPLLEENNRLLERFLASGLTILQLRREIRKQERLEQNVSR